MAKNKGDKGRQESDKELRRLEKKLEKEYTEALSDLQDKANKYFEQFSAEDKLMKAKWTAGDITEKDYKEWRRAKMLSGERYDQMVDTLATDLTNRNRIAAAMINKTLPEAYAANSNWSAYEICRETGRNVAFDLVDHRTVERLMKDNPKLLPSRAGVKIAKDQRWNQQKIRSALTQGILSGESNENIAKRLRSVTDMSASASIRNARTMTTAAENAGRMDRYGEAKEMGIKMKKTWVATLDDRTRDAHALLDGQTVDIDEPFDSILGPIMYPGDPDADPENVYNCRCTMITQIAGYERDVSDRVMGESLGGMTYEEWKESHRRDDEEKQDAQEPETIQHPTVSEQIKGVSKKGEARSEWLEDTLGIEKEEAHEVLKSVQEYTSEGEKYSEIHNNKESAQKDIEKIDSMLKNPNMPVYDGTIYRGVHIDDSDGLSAKEKIDAIISGGQWNEPGITSFSSKKEKASQFATGGAYGDKTQGLNVVIINKNNKTGCPIQHLSLQRPEGEVLVPSDIKDRGYKIIDAKYKDKIEEIPQWHYDEKQKEVIEDKPKIIQSKWVFIEVEENG